MRVTPRTGLNVGLLVVLAAVVIFGVGKCNDQQRGQPQLRMVTIQVGDTPVEVEVADDFQEQRLGYMFRDPPATTGMLFVWPDEQQHAFWMKNVHWDLDLAYIAGDGTVLQIERMKAFNERSVPSHRPARYVLEMPAGRFAELNIEVGDVVTFPPEL